MKTSSSNNDYSLTTDYLKVITNNNFLKTTVPNLTPFEFNLFHGIVGKLKNKGDEVITISFDEAMALSQDPKTYDAQITRLAENMWTKVQMADFSFSIPANEREKYDKKLKIVLFDSLLINPNDRTIKVGVSRSLLFLLNDFEKGNYTSLPYKHIAELKTTSSKKLLMLLTQYNSTGFCTIKIEDLMYIMDCPESYSAGNFNKRVLEKSIKSIEVYFDRIEVTKVLKGRKIIRYEFNFKLKPERDLSNDPGYREFIKSEGSQTVKEVGPRANKSKKVVSKKSKSKKSKQKLTNANDEYTFEQCVEMGIEYIPGMSNEDFLEYNR